MTTQKCFTITVDGKIYGPFLWQYREHEKIKRIECLAGISLSPPIYRAKWKPFAPPGSAKGKTRQVNTSVGRGGVCPGPQERAKILAAI